MGGGVLGVVELGAAASIGLQQEGKLCEVNGGYNFEPPALMLLSLHGVCTAYPKALRATQYDKGACIQNWKFAKSDEKDLLAKPANEHR